MIDEWYSNLPIITKSYITACVVTTLAYHLDIVNLLMLYLNFRLVYERFEGTWYQNTVFSFSPFALPLTHFLRFHFLGTDFLFPESDFLKLSLFSPLSDVV